jgi:hypothetical protein
VLHLASNPVVAVKTGMVLAGVARFGRSFSTSLTDGWLEDVYLTDALEGICGGKFNAIMEDGAIQLKPVL